ncbi:MAG: signal peptide peptidase SppA [Bacteroidetes bacterium]|nr:MAG: signal peptide peptidase SppA [Bacteroidota bacterium]
MSKTAKWLIGIFGFLAVFAFIVIAGIVSLLADGSETQDLEQGTGGTIAVVELNEAITSSQSIVRQFKRYRENVGVRAIVFRIESPGGGVSASQEIYEEVKKTRKYGKPVVVSMGSVAASGGYYVALGADRIVANPGSITGSIGVISQFMHVNGLLDKIGVSSTTIKSGALKDAGSPFRPMTAEDRKYFQEMIDDVHDQFITAVADERKMPKERVKRIADGRVFTGRKALALGLVDTLGTYQDAVRIAADLAGLGTAPRIITERKKERLSDMIFGELRGDMTALRDRLLDQPIVQYRYVQP